MTSDAPIRVAQIVRPAAGGIRRHVSLLGSGLDRTRFLPSVYAPADFNLEGTASEITQHNTAIAARTNPMADVRVIAALSRQLRGNADLVHAHGLRAALIGVLAAKRAGIPALFTAHNLVPPLGRLQRILLQTIGKSAVTIIAVSQAVAVSLQAAGVPENKICVIPNGIPLAPFDEQFDSQIEKAELQAKLFVPNTGPVIAAIGRLEQEKGFDLLISAFDLVLERLPDAHLAIAGTGTEAERLQMQARSVRCPKQIHFLGQLANIIPLLELACLIAVPSRQEGQGIVALEAMAARRAVIAANVGGLAETIVPDVTGLLVSPENPRAFADAIASLLADPARRQAMGLQGRRRVEQLYTVERMITSIQAVYQSLLPLHQYPAA